MKKAILSVAMLLSAAGMQGLDYVRPRIELQQQNQGQYGLISKAYPTNVNVAPGEKVIVQAPVMGPLQGLAGSR